MRKVSIHCVALLSNIVSLSNSSSVKSNVVAENLTPTGALAMNEPELDLSNLIVVPNCVLPVGCGQVTICVSVKTVTPISANVAELTAVNDSLLFGVLMSMFIN